MVLEELRYTQDHEWVYVQDMVATVGVTKYATDELGEIVFVELPELEAEFSQMDEFGTVESVKTVSSLFMPLSGKILEKNKWVEERPALLNDSPFQEGWLVKINIADSKEVDDLMNFEEYQAYLDTL